MKRKYNNVIYTRKNKKIKLLALDVDGVLTNGQIIYDSQEREVKVFDVHDGYGLILLKRAGLKTAIISARSAKPVEIRAKDLKIDKMYQDAYPKMRAYRNLLKDFQLKDEEICFMGDDLPDLPVLQSVGFSVAVANAMDELKDNVDYVTHKAGGEGAVREVVELILKGQDKWQTLINGEMNP